MSRKPNVREKQGYWFSEAGGKARRFGRSDQVSYQEAMCRLWKALAEDHGIVDDSVKPGIVVQNPVIQGKTQSRGRKPDSRHDDGGLGMSKHDRAREQDVQRGRGDTGIDMPGRGMTVNALAEAFFAWLGRNRSDRTLDDRQRHVARFQRLWGGLDVRRLDARHLERFIETLRADGHAPDYVRKHVVSVKAMVNRGVKQRLLPKGFDPFSIVDAIIVPPKVLLESDLPSPDEVRRLFATAKGLMLDVVRLYHATGARTHELIEARCGDYQRQAGTLVLARHKRSNTMRDPKPRVITLNGVARAIVERLIEGRDVDDAIVRNGKGRGYRKDEIARRFSYLRKNASVRKTISIYSFRHLYISEMLMAGVDSLLVARMVGTSVKMIEQVYGHFTTRALADAQAMLDARRKGE